jgi:putative ATP-dependent endonuclease of OLD family
LLEFFKSYQTRETAPAVHLIFIEEPEAHLHPQMAEVFIRKLAEIAKLFATKYNQGVEWPVQFVVSTHSSHMANEAHFESIRYFLATSENEHRHLRSTRIKDLRRGLKTIPQEDRDFLHQYMTLTRCDLFFADKAALIEGCAERLLLPRMIDKVDAESKTTTPLSSQYVSVVEVCGAYAHLFFPLLDFLELPTLVITDLDSGKRDPDNKVRKCKVADGTHTTNGCLKKWFDKDVSPSDLTKKPDADKVRGVVRLAYQVSESVKGGPCGRSFEDAFVLANPGLFGIDKLKSETERADAAWTIAEDARKSEFALRYAIQHTEWNVPRYIAEGIRWLAGVTNTSKPILQAASQTVAVPAQKAKPPASRRSKRSS